MSAVRRKKYRSRKRKKYWKLAVFLLLLLVCGIFITQEFGKDKVLSTAAQKDCVYAKELIGYLHIIPLTDQETETLILPELHKVLTGSDVKTVLEKTGFTKYSETWMSQAGITKESYEREISRAEWTGVYEILLKKLDLKDQVSEKNIQYLGDVKGEKRIIADSGNYDCAPDSMVFSYGKSYPVYLYGNYILGRMSDTDAGNEVQRASEEQSDRKENSAISGQNEAENTKSGKRVSVPQKIRVLVTQGNSGNALRSSVRVKSADGFRIVSGSKKKVIAAGKCADIVSWMKKWKVNQVTLRPEGKATLSLTDRTGRVLAGGYRGSFQVYRGKNGYWVVNDLSLEDYLYGVVPGEMPESYEMEALKAQAVCARTYAVRQIRGKRYEDYEADLNDTTDCQVYRPQNENAKSRKAVDATTGIILTDGSAPAKIYYFSSSCGFTSGMEVWQSEQVRYLQPVNLLKRQQKMGDFDTFIKKKNIQAYDSESLFFRWTATLELKKYSGKLRSAVQKYAANQSSSVKVLDQKKRQLTDCSRLGKCKDLKVNKRNHSGAITELTLYFSKGSVKIYNEYVIRSILAEAMTSLKNKNGKKVDYIRILPSVAFTAEQTKTGTIRCYGGGLGHGVGMSQTGADGMAADGMNCQEILEFFFPGAGYQK